MQHIKGLSLAVTGASFAFVVLTLISTFQANSPVGSGLTLLFLSIISFIIFWIFAFITGLVPWLLLMKLGEIYRLGSHLFFIAGCTVISIVIGTLTIGLISRLSSVNVDIPAQSMITFSFYMAIVGIVAGLFYSFGTKVSKAC